MSGALERVVYDLARDAADARAEYQDAQQRYRDLLDAEYEQYIVRATAAPHEGGELAKTVAGASLIARDELRRTDGDTDRAEREVFEQMGGSAELPPGLHSWIVERTQERMSDD